MSKQKSFWDTKATIHIPLKEKALYNLAKQKECNLFDI